VVLLAGLCSCLAAGVNSEDPSNDAVLSRAVCPIVYQLDRSPTSHGYRYSFFGNGFFINEQGYLLTVAHVLDTFRDGGQPYILVGRPHSPPQLLPASVIATDEEHDVAILLANPNPFAGNHIVTFLPLATEPAFRGQPVMALSVHPPKVQNAHSYQAPQEDWSSGEVLSYETTKLVASGPAADIFLLSHPVTLGQSGSPVLALDSHAAVGLVEGRWLRSRAISSAKSSPASLSTPGAAIPIGQAIALLESHGVSWHVPPAATSSAPAGQH
jgi:hypothetical protein